MSVDTEVVETPSRRPLWASLIAMAIVAAILLLVFHWTVNRVYIDEGYSLLLRYKGPLIFGNPPMASEDRLAAVDDDGDPLEIGVLEQMRGPGRHFFCPIWWTRDKVPDQVVKPGEVAIITSKMGETLPGNQFLVDGDLGKTKHKGILRKAYGPGRYRVNPYAYDVKIVKTERVTDGGQEKLAGWVEIPTGKVGVVTNLTDNPLTGAKAGIQENVLPPGIYPINPKEQQVDVIEIGFRERSISVGRKKDRAGNAMYDPSGEPLIADDPGGLSFPSNDGFTIHMDFTAIWGLMPDQAADAVRKFGNLQAVENKVVLPQIESICRNKGSQLGAVEMLVGESRRQFQIETSNAFRQALHEKDVTLLYGLVRYIYIPQDVREPIQKRFIADELKLTRDQEQLTAKTEANLREAERRVELEGERVKVETAKSVAKLKAEGQKKAEETRARTIQLAAATDKQTADLEAQATVLQGGAEAQAQQMLEEAKAEKFELAVQAFGSGDAYNQWVFANGLPSDLKLNLLYAGPGTFWTDLKGFTETMLGRQVQQEVDNPRALPAGRTIPADTARPPRTARPAGADGQ